ncbi:MAG: glycerol-3-phosphate dehydrogenase subunit GlpB [Ardenticatenaceae bacterium]|nr:glycerol-3-phosphate dehydrogenase subunit GlpB [Ardenticatenaceae bacterium]
MNPNERTIVIGGGLAGLAAAATLAEAGRLVTVLAKGMGGSTHWSSGCIDVLGVYPIGATELVEDPLAAVQALVTANPRHPYALAGEDALRTGLDLVKRVSSGAGLHYEGTIERNWRLPSPVGAPRPTCLAPTTMLAGDLRDPLPMLIVGFHPLRDFYPALVAANLTAQGIPARAAFADVPTLTRRLDLMPVRLARLFEDAAFRQQVIDLVRPSLGEARRVGFPAVLGIDRPSDVVEHLQQALDLPVFEIPTLPPSVPGIRLQNAFQRALERRRGRFLVGAEALSATLDDSRVLSIETEIAARTMAHRGRDFVLATGGLLGGGLRTDYKGAVREVVFDLPVEALSERKAWFEPEFVAPQGHAIWRAGLMVDEQMRPLGPNGAPVYANLRAAGLALAHADPLREKSLEGVSVATGVRAAEGLLEG